MKKHIPLVAVCFLALAVLLVIGTFLRGCLSVSEKLSFVAIFIFTLAYDIAEMGYYGIIAFVDSIVMGSQK